VPTPTNAPDRRVLVVTGASSGIGLEVTRAAARRGWDLVLVARGREALDAAATAAEDLGAASVAVEPLDVRDDDAVAAALERTVAAYGRIDALVHAAGVAAYGRVEDMPRDVFDAVVRTNLLGSVNVARHLLPVLRSQPGGGQLVLLGSVLGHLATPGMTAYAVSKWGIRALARQLQVENRDRDAVHVSYIAPGSVDTPIYETAANYLGALPNPPIPVTSPEHVAAVVLRLLDRPRAATQVGLANQVMRLGFSGLPWVYDALVGPLFDVLALDRDTPAAAWTGNVLAPLTGAHAAHGSRRGSLRVLADNLVATVSRGRPRTPPRP
jgi:NAD(P)-dependent dehydrogenase (short-subunit alcohol dehydrogenase family)